MADKKLTYKEKAGLKFVEQADPPFIQQLKKKMGFREPAKISDKFANEGPSNDEPEDEETEILRMKEEDRPQVVVLNPETDLTKDELDSALESKKKEEDERMIADGKITFKKPVKRVANDDEKSEEKKKPKENPPKKTESRLLSFGDEDEDE